MQFIDGSAHNRFACWWSFITFNSLSSSYRLNQCRIIDFYPLKSKDFVIIALKGHHMCPERKMHLLWPCGECSRIKPGSINTMYLSILHTGMYVSIQGHILLISLLLGANTGTVGDCSKPQQRNIVMVTIEHFRQSRKNPCGVWTETHTCTWIHKKGVQKSEQVVGSVVKEVESN